MTSTKHTLRPYQAKALEEIQNHFAMGNKKVLLHLATGGGKTTIFCEILKRVAAKNKKAIMVVSGRKLVDQASQRLFREDVYHGVLMANHHMHRPKANIQICSIDTLRARKLYPDADLIVIDEAHLATSKSYVDFFQNYDAAFFLAVTATPYMQKSLRYCAEHIVKPISISELIEQGYLIPPKYYAPYIPNLKNVKTRNGDYVNSELTDAMSGNEIVGDIVTQWIKLGRNLPTICFAVSIEHSKLIVNSFNARGIKAVHVDADSSDGDRIDAIRKLENNEIKIISNVGILSIGVDIPCIGTVILARPTKSYNLYVQQLGRGTRPYKDLKEFIVLDHTGNILRHGDVLDEKEANIDAEKIKNVERPVNVKICLECFAAYTGANCYCGNVADKKPREFIQVDGELVEMDMAVMNKKRDAEKFLVSKLSQAMVMGFKKTWAYYQVRDKFGEIVARDVWKKTNIPF